jgi:hypothetical protein
MTSQRELFDEWPRVEMQIFRIGAQEALNQSVIANHCPLFVFQRPEEFGPDLGERFDIDDIDVLRNACLSQS